MSAQNNQQPSCSWMNLPATLPGPQPVIQAASQHVIQAAPQPIIQAASQPNFVPIHHSSPIPGVLVWTSWTNQGVVQESRYYMNNCRLPYECLKCEFSMKIYIDSLRKVWFTEHQAEEFMVFAEEIIQEHSASWWAESTKKMSMKGNGFYTQGQRKRWLDIKGKRIRIYFISFIWSCFQNECTQ